MNRREHILAAQDIKSEIIRVDAWGGVEIEVRGLTGRQRERVIAAARDDEGVIDDAKVIVPLIIASAFDPETKQPLFTEADRDSLGEKSAVALEVVAKVAIRLAGISQQETENIRGNSPGTPSGASTSA